MLTLFSQSAIGQTPTILWQKTLGGSSGEVAKAITATADGGYVMAGNTRSNDGDVSGFTGNDDIWVVKVDAAGQFVWQKTLGGPVNPIIGPSFDYAYGITETADGGYLVVGSTISYVYVDPQSTAYNNDAWIIKLNGAGQLVWQKTLGGTGNDVANAVTRAADGNYIVAGTTSSNDGDVTGNHGSDDMWVIKLSEAGQILWQKTLGGSDTEEGNTVTATADGGVVVAGRTFSNDGDISGFHGLYDYWIVRLNEAGQILWQKTLGGSSAEAAYSLIKTSDGGYAVAGFTYSTDGDVIGGNTQPAYWILKLSATAQIQWQKRLNGITAVIIPGPYGITESPDQGIVFAGSTFYDKGNGTGSSGGIDAWVAKLDKTGQLVWQKALGGSETDGASALTISPDGGYVVAGYTGSNDRDVTGNHGSVDFWAVKLSAALTQSPTLTNLTATPTPTCAGLPVQFSAKIGNLTSTYSFTLTNGASSTLTGTASTSAFSQNLLVSESGPQTFTLTINTSGGPASATINVPVQVTSAEFQALVNFYKATNGPNWTNHTNWLSGCSPCDWFGVTCNPNGRVIALYLPNNQLNGTLSPNLSALTKLRLLNLTKNQLTGPIPASLGQLTDLQVLYLNNNSFSGTLPTSLSALSQLQLLDASNNQLSGSIPTGLSALSQLKALYLSKNQLSGSIPASLSSLTNLQLLYLNNNKLSGSIPSSLGSLTLLQYLFLNNNQLSGCFPASLSALCGRTVDISGNTGLPGGGNFSAFCSTGSGRCGSARQGADETVVGLQVIVQGNPVAGNELVVDVVGGKGLPLVFQLQDISGRLVSERVVEQAAEVERQRMLIRGVAAGVLLLRVSSPDQERTIKVVSQ
ncbi:hypothetical protein [Spirosoma sp. KNUC1025]|uniref:leucine-rich repeat domain-containing protein n=1 Tax=Spirosoma sp. KNUC1025 TaxID=2894082 RepID=UPI003864F526|nr:hypothetical protein LN737_00590 [Spirosoma sp. KNUC1025]